MLLRHAKFWATFHSDPSMQPNIHDSSFTVCRCKQTTSKGLWIYLVLYILIEVLFIQYNISIILLLINNFTKIFGGINNLEWLIFATGKGSMNLKSSVGGISAMSIIIYLKAFSWLTSNLWVATIYQQCTPSKKEEEVIVSTWEKGKKKNKKFSNITRVNEPEPLVQLEKLEPGQCK